MKSPWVWTEEDILSLISEGEKESLTLDYKACASLQRTDGKKNELSKDVSAMANSAGGTLVYGVLEDGFVPVKIDSGYDPSEISKEWIEQVINSRVQRRIDGISINQVDLTQTNPGKVMYVVHIPQSNRAPHMASDKRYYKRFNFESVPMEEYEVRDIANRGTSPDLRLVLESSQKSNYDVLEFEQTSQYSKPIKFELCIQNNSIVAAHHATIQMYIDARLKLNLTSFTRQDGDFSFRYGNYEFRSNLLLYRHIAESNHVPLLEGLRYELNPMSIALPKEPGQYIVHWIIRAPDMRSKSGIFILNSAGTNFFINDVTASSEF